MIWPSIFTALTENKGWGVFTSKKIPQDTIIEISPVIVLSGKEKLLIDQTILYNYIFHWEKGKACMAMGNIPIYNHACPSNCEYFQDYAAQTIYIKTVRVIKPHEELTINYQGDFDCETPVWFDASSD